MEENYIPGLNINGEDITNQDIIVVYTPDSSITNYRYIIYKDNIKIDEQIISNNNKSNIILDETGTYHIEIITHDIYGYRETYTTDKYNIDKIPPVIEVDTQLLEVEKGSTLDLYADLIATDNIDGDLKNKVTTNYDELDLNEVGIKKLIYTVSDEAGNTTTKTVNLNVVDSYAATLLYIQISIIIVLLSIVFLIIKYRRGLELDRRISQFSVNALRDNSLSLLDSIANFYYKIINKITSVLKKSVFMTKYSKKYDKYVLINDTGHKTGYDFVASKIIISFIFLLIAIFSKTIQYQVLHLYEIVFPLLVGFFLPDILYMIKYRLYRDKIENDLLQAIIVMNNAFKSGRSIIQAIELVSIELDGAIAEEFKKMYLELSFGLEIDIVFNRFADRIKLEEVSYLTASLSILNRTGGNIINVFSSIEKSLFNKKKLKIELASLTGSSKLIVYVLFLVPILFVLFVSIINPTYFVPFFTTPIGLILLTFMIIYYITYIIFVRKIMKVRM